MKQHDFLLGMLNNPQFSPQDFKEVAGMNLDNTQFLTRNNYKNFKVIRDNDLFKDDNGRFSDEKFDKFYDLVATAFSVFSSDVVLDNYEYSVFDTAATTNKRTRLPDFVIGLRSNPEHISIGMSGINEVSQSNKTWKEYAQDLQIYNTETGKFEDYSVNQISFLENPFGYMKSLFNDPLVYATYDLDTVEVDPYTGNKVKHLKGEKKVNRYGEYYTETLGGRNIRDKEVVSAADYITSENSKINKYDFFDSDDQEKSIAGIVTKNVVSVLPMLIPGLGAAGKVWKVGSDIYSGLLITRELSKAVPMVYGMLGSLTGDNNPNSKLANTIAAYGLKFTGGTSLYAQEHTFSFENIGQLMSDVALQWGLLKLIAKGYLSLTNRGTLALATAEGKALSDYQKNLGKYLEDLQNNKITLALFTQYTGINNPGEILTKAGELMATGGWKATALGSAALKKYIPEAEKIFRSSLRMGLDLSLAYMALISNTDVYDSILLKGGTAGEAALMAFGSMVGMFSVDRYLGLGELFFDNDLAKKAIRTAAKENAEIFMSGKKALDTTSKKGIVNTILKGTNLGKNIVSSTISKIKNKELGVFGKAIGEGLEEVSEELVTDIVKLLGEFAGKLGLASQTDYGAWDNSLERYGMSLLGGTLGGGLFGGIEYIKNKRNPMKDFNSEIGFLLREGKKDEIYKELNNLKKQGRLGSTNLSYDTEVTENGEQVYVTADKEHKSQAEVNYNELVKTIESLDLILNDNKINLSDDLLFDNLVLGEYRATALSDFLLGDGMSTAKSVSYITRYYEDFERLKNQIIEKQNEINTLTAQSPDALNRRDSSYDSKLKSLQEELQTLLELKEYMFGEGSLGYIEKMNFAIDTRLSGQFLSINYAQYVRERLGKSVELLSEAEEKTLSEEYENIKGKKVDLDTAFNLYKEMELKLRPEVQDLADNDYSKEIKEITELRLNDPFNNEIDPFNGYLPTDTSEDIKYLNVLKDGESEEDFKNRVEEHRQKIIAYNRENKYKWILEYVKRRLTKSDFRYLVSKLDILRNEAAQKILEDSKIPLELFTTYLTTSKSVTNIDLLLGEIYNIIINYSKKNLSELSTIDKLKTDIKDLIKSTFKLSTIDTSATTVDGKTLYLLFSEMELNKTNPNYTIPRDFVAPKGIYSIGDIMALISYRSKLLDLDSSLFTKIYEDIEVFNDYDIVIESFSHTKELTNNELAAMLEFYKRFLKKDLDEGVDDSFINSYIKAKKDLTKYYQENKDPKYSTSEYKEDIIEDSFVTIESELDKLITKINELNDIKTLNLIEAAAYILSPVIPIIEKINPNIKILLDLYETYKSNDSVTLFLLTPELLTILKDLIRDIQIASAFIYGASIQVQNGHPIGHNHSLNLFVENHKDVFKDFEKLPEIDEANANFLLLEFDQYLKEIQNWINIHERNSLLREIIFTKTDEAIYKTLLDVFKTNRLGFKLEGGVDLLEGYEDLQLDSSLSSLLKVKLLLYKNYKNSKLTETLVISLLLPKIIKFKEAINLYSANLSANLTYKSLTLYDLFLIIISSLAVDPVEFYTNMYQFIEKEPSLAPLSMQEYAANLVYVLKANPEFINKALDFIKEQSGSNIDIAYNTAIVTGVGGSGKTFGVSKFNIKEKEKVWLSGPSETQQNGLKDSIPQGTIKTIEEILDIVNTDKTKDLPSMIIFDEATWLHTDDILKIADFCKKNNILFLLLGDYYQAGVQSHIETNSIISWRSPQMLVSLRSANATKLENSDKVRRVMILSNDNLFKTVLEELNAFNKLGLKYYNKDYFAGDIIVNDLPFDILSKIPKDATVGYIGVESSEVYKKLQESGLKVSGPYQKQAILGKEFDYVIIDTDWLFKSITDSLLLDREIESFYTMITRSKMGSIIINRNGLLDNVETAEVSVSGEYSSLKDSIDNFRNRKLPIIELAIKDNPLLDSLKKTTIKQTTLELPTQTDELNTEILDPEFELDQDPKYIPVNEQPKEVLNSELTLDKTIINTSGITSYVFSGVRYSGIEIDESDPSNIKWKGNDSNTDLGIFIKKGQTVKRDRNGDFYLYLGTKKQKAINKKNIISDIINLGNLFIYSTDEEVLKSYYDERIGTNLLNKFSIDEIIKAFNNNDPETGFFIQIEDVTDSNKLIGFTSKQGLTNDKRATYGNKIIKLVVKLKDVDGNICTVSIGGLSNPETWLRSYEGTISKKLNESEREEYKKNIDNYKAKLLELLDRKITELPIAKPEFNGISGIYNLGKDIPLEGINTDKYSEYNNIAPLQVTSDPFIIINPEDSLRGRAFMYASTNTLLKRSELEDRYPEDLSIRRIMLGNIGVSFDSLTLYKYKDLYAAGGDSTPFRTGPAGLRIYIAMWNYRASLNRLMKAFTEFKLRDNLEAALIALQLFYSLYIDSKSEESFSDWLQTNYSENVKELNIIDEFNDSIKGYVKDLRLRGVSKLSGIMVDQINVGNEFSPEENKVYNGLYLTLETLEYQVKALDLLFENIVDIFIDIPISTDKTDYINGKLKDLKTLKLVKKNGKVEVEKGTTDDGHPLWYNFIRTNSGITLNYSEKDDQLTVKNGSRLAQFVMSLLKAYKYSKIYSKDTLNEIILLDEGESLPKIYLDTTEKSGTINWQQLAILTGKTFLDKSKEHLSYLFNSMFHGTDWLTSENNFNVNLKKSDFAYFKFGILSDPIVVKKKEGGRAVDTCLTSPKLLSANAVLRGPRLLINLLEREIKKPEVKEKPTTTIEEVSVISELELYTFTNLQGVNTSNPRDIANQLLHIGKDIVRIWGMYRDKSVKLILSHIYTGGIAEDGKTFIIGLTLYDKYNLLFPDPNVLITKVKVVNSKNSIITLEDGRAFTINVDNNNFIILTENKKQESKNDSIEDLTLTGKLLGDKIISMVNNILHKYDPSLNITINDITDSKQVRTILLSDNIYDNSIYILVLNSLISTIDNNISEFIDIKSDIEDDEIISSIISDLQELNKIKDELKPKC